ncbi:unnamed protein product [Mytilus coruscus]|uniref:Schlafen AlbA-2 domain-containing protein n=1 Tax=Mytilus coruscus TaxID=42192 RepID=A0A6J8AKK2_MYTCO|nr:unnamed protein product [Mytilus coruscus]
MEFKLGGGDYVRNNLRENVSKYVCAYLNGRTEGTLVWMVDRGHVVGVNCEDEDKIRRSYIDESIRDIKPPVDNKDYQVEFVPVEDNGKIEANCKVIKITVYKRKQLNRLFDSKGHVYMRRDCCVRDFSAAEAQDWILQVCIGCRNDIETIPDWRWAYAYLDTNLPFILPRPVDQQYVNKRTCIKNQYMKTHIRLPLNSV